MLSNKGCVDSVGGEASVFVEAFPLGTASGRRIAADSLPTCDVASGEFYPAGAATPCANVKSFAIPWLAAVLDDAVQRSVPPVSEVGDDDATGGDVGIAVFGISSISWNSGINIKLIAGHERRLVFDRMLEPTGGASAVALVEGAHQNVRRLGERVGGSFQRQIGEQVAERGEFIITDNESGITDPCVVTGGLSAENAFVVLPIHHMGDGDLADVGDVGGLAGGFADFADGGDDDGSKDANDGNDRE